MPMIAYIAQQFPNLTATFIYREVLALRNRGFEVVTLSNRPADIDKLSAEAKHLVEETIYIFPINWPRFLTAHAYFLLTQPHIYLATLLFVMTRPGESRSNRWRTFLHFGGAIYLAVQLRQRGISHIHAHFSVNAATIALVIARMLNIGFSFTAHNNFFTDKLLIREKIRAAKFIAAISEYSRDYLLNLVPDEPHLADKFHIIHCGVSLETFTPRPAKTESTKPLIFSIAHLVERKGMPVLVEACRLLRDQGCEFECIIAGDGEQRPQLAQMIAEYQLSAEVKLVGLIFQEALADYLNRADLFVLACVTAQNGDKDGIPVVLMEAMAMEIPVISTYVSGIPELIETEQSGLLVPEQDAVALAKAIKRLLTDEPLRRRFGRQGRQKVMAEFNIERTSADMAALFEQYVGGNKG